MSVLWSYQLSTLLIFLSVEYLNGRDSDCPRAYWDEPSRRCSDNLHAVLEEARVGDKPLAAELRINKTCREWERTNSCYQQLIQRCNGDKLALQEIRMHIGRYVIYSLPCQQPNRGHKKILADCFLPDIQLTRTCTDTVDNYLRKFLITKQYRGACRVISMALRCFHGIKHNIQERCLDEAADQYHNNYIQPLVDHTRDMVLKQCKFSSPFMKYFESNRSPVTCSHSRRVIFLGAFLLLFHKFLIS